MKAGKIAFTFTNWYFVSRWSLPSSRYVSLTFCCTVKSEKNQQAKWNRAFYSQHSRHLSMKIPNQVA